jgi:hypothetical protein
VAKASEITFDTDANGFRKTEFVAEPGTPTVLFVGDSLPRLRPIGFRGQGPRRSAFRAFERFMRKIRDVTGLI